MQLAGDEPSPLTLRVRRELLTDLLQCAEIDRFEVELERYEREGHDLSSPRDIYWAMALRATEATLHGDLTTGEQLARGAAVRGFDLDPGVAGAEYLQRFVIRFQQGRMSEMLSADGRRHGRNHRAAHGLPGGRGALGARPGRNWSRRPCRTQPRAGRSGPDGQGITRDSLWLAAHALLSVVAFVAGDLDLAALLDQQLTPCASHMVTFGAGAAVLGCGHHWLGLLAGTQGMPDRVVEHLTEAAAVSVQVRAPFWLAQARFDLANVLETRDRTGDRERADELRTEALRAASAGGFERILARSTSHHPG